MKKLTTLSLGTLGLLFTPATLLPSSTFGSVLKTLGRGQFIRRFATECPRQKQLDAFRARLNEHFKNKRVAREKFTRIKNEIAQAQQLLNELKDAKKKST